MICAVNWWGDCEFYAQQLNSGKIVAVGPGLRDKGGNTIAVAVEEGDTVLLPEFGGTQLKLEDTECV